MSLSSCSATALTLSCGQLHTCCKLEISLTSWALRMRNRTLWTCHSHPELRCISSFAADLAWTSAWSKGPESRKSFLVYSVPTRIHPPHFVNPIKRQVYLQLTRSSFLVQPIVKGCILQSQPARQALLPFVMATQLPRYNISCDKGNRTNPCKVATFLVLLSKRASKLTLGDIITLPLNCHLAWGHSALTDVLAEGFHSVT